MAILTLKLLALTPNSGKLLTNLTNVPHVELVSKVSKTGGGDCCSKFLSNILKTEKNLQEKTLRSLIYHQ